MRTMGTGDATSRIDERKRPVAYPWENQTNVNIFHSVYLLFFSWQDRIICGLAGNGSEDLKFELTVSSSLGFGMQSLVIFALAVSENLIFLPELILGANMAMMALVFIRSRL
mgnify:FL=1